MTETYRVALKDSVFEETLLEASDFDDPPELEFGSVKGARTWVDEQNEFHSKRGELSLRDPHPNDSADVEAYVVFQPIQGEWVYAPE